jgi:hypothetical protein
MLSGFRSAKNHNLMTCRCGWNQFGPLGEQAFRDANKGVPSGQLLLSHRPLTSGASSDPIYYCRKILVA